MTRSSCACLATILLLGAVNFSTAHAQAVATASQDASLITLPAPDKSGGKPLMQVLGERRSQREFSPAPLPVPVLSNLLWAAFGVNRPDGHRTAPSARNWQEVTIYAVMADGVHVYDASRHALRRVSAEDTRAATGNQPFVAGAPLNLVFVADATKQGDMPDIDRQLYSGLDVGVIVQNVYLFCASEASRPSYAPASIARRSRNG
jgi:hypothetical protein